MGEPTTEAGKQLRRSWDDMEGEIGVSALIAAIEVEARASVTRADAARDNAMIVRALAAYRGRLAAAVGELGGIKAAGIQGAMVSFDGLMVRQDAVLRLIEETA